MGSMGASQITTEMTKVEDALVNLIGRQASLHATSISRHRRAIPRHDEEAGLQGYHG